MRSDHVNVESGAVGGLDRRHRSDVIARATRPAIAPAVFQ
jgi:hypothetical protein